MKQCFVNTKWVAQSPSLFILITPSPAAAGGRGHIQTRAQCVYLGNFLDKGKSFEGRGSETGKEEVKKRNCREGRLESSVKETEAWKGAEAASLRVCQGTASLDRPACRTLHSWG